MTVIFKSSYIRGIKCLKALYLHLYYDELCDDTDFQQALELHRMGIHSFEEIPGDFRFTEKEWELAEADLLNWEIRNEEALRLFAGNLTWPIYFMDFETIMPAIPLFDESRPYQQIPFQYTVHIRQQPGGETLYHPAMKGSYSIKAVLPSLVNDLSYDDLKIHEGATASLTYLSLNEDTDPNLSTQSARIC